MFTYNMLCIELMEYDQADRFVDSLRKYISKPVIKNNIEKRYLVITNILFNLSKKSYSFKKIFDAKKEQFKLLASKNKDYGWQIKSPEMIVFDEWFKCKLNDTQYNHKEVMEMMIKRFSGRSTRKK